MSSTLVNAHIAHQHLLIASAAKFMDALAVASHLVSRYNPSSLRQLLKSAGGYPSDMLKVIRQHV